MASKIFLKIHIQILYTFKCNFVALSDETVWVDALLVFYEVFKCLEEFKEDLSMAEMEKLFVDKRLLRY